MKTKRIICECNNTARHFVLMPSFQKYKNIRSSFMNKIASIKLPILALAMAFTKSARSFYEVF